MKKLTLMAAISLFAMISANGAWASTIKPIYKIDKDSMKTFCSNSGGTYYETPPGGYGCNAKGGKTTKECGNNGKCVHISHDDRVAPTPTNTKPFSIPAGGLLNERNPGLQGANPSQTGAPIAPTAVPARIL